MINPDILKEPFFQVTIPLAGVLVATTWAMASTNNHRLTDMRDTFNRRFDDVKETLGEIKVAIRDLDKRVGTLGKKVDAIDMRAWTGR